MILKYTIIVDDEDASDLDDGIIDAVDTYDGEIISFSSAKGNYESGWNKE